LFIWSVRSVWSVSFNWFVWFVLFIWLNQTNRINQMNQINKTNQINQIDRACSRRACPRNSAGLKCFFRSLLYGMPWPNARQGPPICCTAHPDLLHFRERRITDPYHLHQDVQKGRPLSLWYVWFTWSIWLVCFKQTRQTT
jgi:hypothetical protein